MFALFNRLTLLGAFKLLYIVVSFNVHYLTLFTLNLKSLSEKFDLNVFIKLEQVPTKQTA